jgi:hypothetical protein
MELEPHIRYALAEINDPDIEMQAIRGYASQQRYQLGSLSNSSALYSSRIPLLDDKPLFKDYDLGLSSDKFKTTYDLMNEFLPVYKQLD